jgi:hypothetical protein
MQFTLNSMLRVLGYLAVLTGSFFATIWLIDRHSDQHSRLLGANVIYNMRAQELADVCATTASNIEFTGQICNIDGDTVSVFWNSLANTTNTQPSCGPEKVIRWYRKPNDPAYNARYFGLCGVGPQYFKTMPAVFDPKVLRAAPSN